MKNLKRLAIAALITAFAILSIPTTAISDYQIETATPFKKSGTDSWITRNPLWEFGTSTFRIAKMYVEDMDIVTMLVGGEATGTLDMNGNTIILDEDADTSMTADTDDQIDFEIGGLDDFQMTANMFSALAGSFISIGRTIATVDLDIYRNDSSTTPMFSIEQDGSGDATFRLILTALRAYSIGIDNSETNDPIEIAATSTGVGTHIWQLTNTGDNDITGSFSFGGALTGSIVNANAATYSTTNTDFLIHSTYSTTGTQTITLQTADCWDGRMLEIKDGASNATTNNITVDTQGSEKIDGADTLLLDEDDEEFSLYCYSSNWYIK